MELDKIDTTNWQCAAPRGGGGISVIRPKANMTEEEALVHAAWIVALADPLDEWFPQILAKVRET